MGKRNPVPVTINDFGPRPGGLDNLPGVNPEGGRPRKSLDFPGLVMGNPFVAQTVNGTAREGNTPGHNQDIPWTMPEARPVGTWRKGNRSGE